MSENPNAKVLVCPAHPKYLFVFVFENHEWLCPVCQGRNSIAVNARKAVALILNGYEIRWNPHFEKWHVSHPEIGADIAQFNTFTQAKAYCQNG